MKIHNYQINNNLRNGGGKKSKNRKKRLKKVENSYNISNKNL